MNALAMNIFTIDTLQFSKRMQKAGLQKEVADELAEALKENQTQSIEGLATKADIASVKADITSLEYRLEQKMELLKKDIIIKLGSLMAFGITIIVILIKF
jgi:hypothetical protein